VRPGEQCLIEEQVLPAPSTVAPEIKARIADPSPLSNTAPRCHYRAPPAVAEGKEVPVSADLGLC
jgi:hypothetical protein